MSHLMKVCEEEGCNKPAIKKGLCAAHNRARDGLMERRCTVDGCQKQAQAYCLGYCIMHAKMYNVQRDPKAKTARQCKQEGCEKYARRKGFCSTHGRFHDIQQAPPTATKVCIIEGCGKWPRTKGLCTYHARDAGLETRRCKQEGCIKGPCRKGYCMVHARGRGYYNGELSMKTNGVHGHEVVDDPAGDGMPMMMQQVPPSPASSEPIERHTLGRVAT